MYEGRIATGDLTVTAIHGFPSEIDALAARNLSGHAFLRAAWFQAGAQQNAGRTLLIQRGNGVSRAVIAAIPTTAFGPAMMRARKVSGSYWPFRSALIAPDCNAHELAQGLKHTAARSLGPVWRLGPVPVEDPATTLLINAARLAGWTVLGREAGTSWLIDLDAARAEGWPRPSTAKRLDRAERRLAKLGQVQWRHVRGASWNDRVLEQLGAVEADSWIADETDGSGAKFMTPEQRGQWRRALADPVLAEMLCATILTIDDRPVAFSFDLDDGPVQYGIAGSYVSRLARHDIGKLANYRAMTDAIADGQKMMDMGAGDSGYKRAMGAYPGYRMSDLLFVRSRTAARLLSGIWGRKIGLEDRFSVSQAAHFHD